MEPGGAASLQGEADRKNRTPVRVSDRKRASMGFDDSPRDRETQAVTLVVVFQVANREFVEDVFLNLRRNWVAVVGDIYADTVFFMRDPDAYRGSRPGELHRIIEQRIHGDAEKLWIGHDRDSVRMFPAEKHVLSFGFPLEARFTFR